MPEHPFVERHPAVRFFSPVIDPMRSYMARHFPERHILLKDHRRVICIKVRTSHQVIASGAVLGCMIWALLATVAFLTGASELANKDQEIAARAAEIDDMRNNYQAAFGQLDEFQTIFSGITCEITDIQDSLLKISETNVGSGRKSSVSMPRLDPDANKCRSIDGVALAALPSAPMVDSRRIVAVLPGNRATEPAATPPRSELTDRDSLQRRVTQLSEKLTQLRESHGAFLRHSADLTALRIGELERTLAAVGVATKTGVERHFGRGGPFIAAPLVASPTGSAKSGSGDDFNPISLFNAHADRLDNLANVLKTLPLNSPLADYELTSPYGARNDPINAMTGIHEGLDLGAASGTPVSATGDGQVVWASWRDRYGNMVEIDHGNGLHTRYAHLSRITVALGAHIARGSVLGLVGETGRTTGPHLHYEVRMDDQATNPMKFIQAGQHVLKTQ